MRTQQAPAVLPKDAESSCASVAAVAAPVVMIGGSQPAVTHLRTDAQAGNVADRQQGCEVMSNKHACRRRHATGKGTAYGATVGRRWRG